MIKLRDYQQALKDDIYRHWSSSVEPVIAVAPTGSGKTVLMSSVAMDRQATGIVAVIAHRSELVSQISIALARMDIQHDIIASKATVTFCIQQQIAELGRRFHRHGSRVSVVSVDTLKARADRLGQWASQVRTWMIDEAHHVLTGNKWGGAVSMFPNAIGLGVTATPIRADRKSLHVDQGGVFRALVNGPSMRELIRRGSLCDYRIFAPPVSIDTSHVKIGSTGDFAQPGLRAAAHESKIVGDVVEHYKRLANGLRGITFVVDVEQAIETAAAFNDAGVPAMAVSAKTPDAQRADAVRKLRDGRVLQLVNVDLFGEGFDVPAVEVVSMARPTMSYGLYVQQFGRALRPLNGKSHGIIIDHVGNVRRHGLPDAPREWTLYNEERGKRRQRDERVTPVTSCVVCFAAYEALTPVCPYCGHRPEPEGRSRPEQVDGDLIELDPAALREMRGEIEAMDAGLVDPYVPSIAADWVAKGIRNRARERSEAQTELRRVMSIWAGVRRDLGDDDHAIYRRFYHRFGIDTLSAQTLGRKDADALTFRIKEDWDNGMG